MRLLALALILELTCLSSAQAGAWLRAKGEGFASTTVSTTRSRELSTSVYLEYGVTDQITLGGDFYYGSDLTTFQEGSGIVFLRFPLGPTDRTHRWAAHIGVGTRYFEMEFQTATEIGLSWGRGIAWGERYGWVNVDTSFNSPQAPAQDRVKLDATVGLGITDRSKVMLQLFNTFEGGEAYIKLAPSYLFTPKDSKSTFQVSIETPLSGGGETALKLGVWYAF